MKKSISKILVVVLIFSFMLSACGTNKSNDDQKVSKEQTDTNKENLTPVGEFPIVKEPINISMGVLQDPNVEDFETNAYTKWLEETSGINIDFKYFPNKEATQKLAIMINSNEKLPEVLVGFRLSTIDVDRYGKQGYFKPLNDYVDNKSVNIKKVYEEHPEVVKYFTSSDGNIYTVPQFTEQLGNMFPLRAWINQKWLDKLGLDMPTTPEELQNVLQQFKDKDPNGNSKPDEIPMIGCSSLNFWFGDVQSWLMNAFIYDDTKDKLIVKDGKIEPIYNKGEYKQGLKYMNGLCEAGLLSPLTFTQDKAQYKQLLVSGDNNVNVAGVWVAGGTLFPRNDERMADYKPLEPLKGSNGLQVSTYSPAIPLPRAYITNNCKNDEAAFRLLDLMYSEDAAMRARYGVEGEDWRYKQDGEIGMFEESMGIEGKFKCLQFPWSEPVQNQHWKNTGLQCRSSNISDAIIPDDNPLESEYLISTHVPVNYAVRPDDSTIVPAIIYSQEELEELGDIKTIIKEYVNESTARFITGNMDIDKQWDKYIKELNNMGLEKYIELTQQAWDRMNK